MRLFSVKTIFGSLAAVLVLLSLVVSAQDAPVKYPVKPDNEQILREIIDGNSKYYYPVLFARYKQGDTTITLEGYRHLYYGFPYQEDYAPLNANPALDKLRVLIETAGEKPTNDQLLQQIDAAKEVMVRQPFSLSNINFLSYAYATIGDVANAKINAHRFKMVVEAIRSSGTGLTEKTPLHIIDFSDAIDLLDADGVKHRDARIVSRTVEYFDFIGQFYGTKGYYFDYSRVYWRKPDVTPERPKKPGFQINGMTVGRPK